MRSTPQRRETVLQAVVGAGRPGRQPGVSGVSGVRLLHSGSKQRIKD